MPPADGVTTSCTVIATAELVSHREMPCRVLRRAVRIATTVTSAPTRYTHGHHDSVLRSHRWRTANNSAKYLIDHLRPGLTLLDIGCGAGTITADLAALVSPGKVSAVDTSQSVLSEAKSVAGDRGLRNVDFTVADAHNLRFADNSFDIVHAHQVLQHLSDPVRALKEMRRVCKPGGLVAARDADYSAMSWHPEPPGLDEWRSLYRRVARAQGGDPDAGRRLLSWARQAGFDDVACGASTWCFATPEDRAWWGGSWEDRVKHSALADHALRVGHAKPGDLRRIAAAWRTWAAADDGWFAVLHGEILCVA